MNEDVKVICEVKDKVLDLLHQANQAKEFSMGDVDFLYKATKAVKNACEIEEMMDGGYSEANRGQHYVRGHYSRDADSRNGYSTRRDSRSRYSRDDGRSEMMEHIAMAIDTADERDREKIKRFMRELENA